MIKLKLVISWCMGRSKKHSIKSFIDRDSSSNFIGYHQESIIEDSCYYYSQYSSKQIYTLGQYIYPHGIYIYVLVINPRPASDLGNNYSYWDITNT